MTRYSLIPAAQALVTLATLVTLPTVAAAGNGLHPRTPVDWTGAPCMTVIDRTRGSSFPLVYTIPYEDTDVTPDEVANSRTHQFFGFCRDHHREELLPSWISEADLAAADAAGLGDASSIDAELAVLDNAPDWADCWVRINTDDQRRPITFAAAAEPVIWDIDALPAGAWAVEGYTYEPWANEWWPHPGVFKIIDDPDPAATGPAAALDFAEQIVEFGGEASITGCVDAMPGATMTASWAISGFGMAPQWQVIASDLPADTGAFELGWMPPIEAVSNSVLIKLEIDDPMGRSWTAHANNYIAVTEDFGGESDGCGGGFVSCEDEGGTDGTATETGAEDPGTSSDDGATTGSPSTESGEAGGCSCSTADADNDDDGNDSDAPLAWATLGLALIMGAGGRRRRGLSSRPGTSAPSARD